MPILCPPPFRKMAAIRFLAIVLLLPFAACKAQPGPKSGPSRAADFKDIAYATVSPAQKLDVYLPATGKKPFPVIVSIHGGAFMFGDKADGQVNPMLEAMKRGYAVVSINYRLSGEAIFPAQIHDVKAAIRWVRAQADTYGLDSARIAVWGGSAGGHLSALAGVSGDVAALEDLSLGNAGFSSRVHAVVDWFGPIDFLTMDEQFRQSGKGKPDHSLAGSPESKLLGAQITTVPELVAKASPASYITSDDPPFFIQHGTIDHLIPTAQSEAFAAALVTVLGKEKVTLSLLEGADHGGPAFDAPANVALVLDFLDATLK